jgi:hypothetical protein
MFPDVSDPIEELHRRLFGFVPSKPGTAYERLTAVVLAALGWREVVHDLRETRKGKRAKHQLDVVAVNPVGERRRLIVECKYFDGTARKGGDRTVGKGIADTLVGVLSQLGADDGAIVSSVRFTKGARAVAADEEIAMVSLRPYDAVLDEGQFIVRITITITPQNPPTLSDVHVEAGAVEGAPSFAGSEMDPYAHLEHDDGTHAETIATCLSSTRCDLASAHSSAARIWLSDGGYPSTAVESKSKGVTWTETITNGPAHTTVVEREGEPQLVVFQLDPDGVPTSGRLVVDRDLFAWDIDEQNHVIPRGKLIAEP